MHRRSPQTADSRSTSAATTPGRHARAWLVWPEDDSGRCWTVEAPTASDAIMDAVPRLTAHAVTVLEVTADAVTICAEDYSATIRAALA